jgi:hypothetical protein
MLHFLDWEEILDPETMQKWFETAGETEFSFHMDEHALTLAMVNGKRARIPLGGDLLSPGADPAEAMTWVAPFFAEGKAVVHDGKHLMHMMDRWRIALPDGFVWDTMLGAYLLNPQEKSYQLKLLCPEWEPDAAAVCSLWQWQKQKIAEEGMTELMEKVEMPLSMTLFRMEREGFAVDIPFLKELGEQYSKEIALRKQEVINACGQGEFNLNSPKQLGEILFEKMNLPHGKKTATGYSTSAEVLENLRWEYSATRGYAASGTTALCNVGKTQLHVNVRYRAQLFKRGSDIHFILYLQIANDHWYYFNYDYRTHHLSISSSVGEWNDRIVGIKKDKRTGDNYSYSLTNSRNEIQNFLSGFTGEPVDEEEEELEEE